MWNLLKKSDIDQAKQKLNLRREATLRRHAEESQKLDADRLELETLNQLIEMFTQRFVKPPAISHAPIPPPVSHHHAASKPAPEARNQNHRDRPRTNFEIFTHALSRG